MYHRSSGTAVPRSSKGTQVSDASNQLAYGNSTDAFLVRLSHRDADCDRDVWLMTMDMEAPRKKRAVDNSNGDARRAVADVVRRLEPMRAKVAIVSARTSRTHSSAERTELLAECDEVARACQDSRIELLDRLIDAPFKVVSHSRVADVEKAIDNLEAAVIAAKRQLSLPN